VAFQAGENVLVTKEAGYALWKEQGTDVTLSFPVNALEAQVVLATTKDEAGNFRVDALSTDGGGIPRNTMIRQGLDLCRFGAFSPSELAGKLSVNTAAMLGLETKGHLAPGADADITVLDPAESKAYMAVALGEIIMIDGVVTGSGGTIITTELGKEKVQSKGVACTVADPKKALPKKQR
jgi:imidazolonepropionase-like amidohydrolase